MAHTPGPLIVLQGEEGWIVDTPHERPDADGALAYVAYYDDAVLYAAAPDLLAACEAFLAYASEHSRDYCEWGAVYEQVHAAVTNARAAPDTRRRTTNDERRKDNDQ
jgi:hypothetical protein